MSAGGDVIARTCASAARLGLDMSEEELADIALRESLGEAEMDAVGKVLGYLGDKRERKRAETLLRLSRLPLREPCTFDNFDFSRLQGDGVEELRRLPSLANLYARSNIAMIGPSGVGKTHLAQAYGRECCLRGAKAYYLKGNELRDRLDAIARKGGPRAMDSLVKPSCLIIDELGRCKFDEDCTTLFFDMVDRRYEKDGPCTMVLTSNRPASGWGAYFTGDDALLCALDRMFDRASVFLIKGTSYRGRDVKTFSLEAMPQVSSARGQRVR